MESSAEVQKPVVRVCNGVLYIITSTLLYYAVITVLLLSSMVGAALCRS